MAANNNKNLTLLSFIHIPYGSKKLKEIMIKNIIPDSLSYQYSPNFSAQSILGRMSPIQLYTGGSDISYSFSLTLHEDALVSSCFIDGVAVRRLDDFVDSLKALAYPSITDDLKRGSVIKSPNVSFQIGEISGRGLVNVSVGWKKPIRDGRYIMADISFSITAERIFPKANYYIGDENVVVENSQDLTYGTKVKITEDEYNAAMLEYGGNDYIDSPTSEHVSDLLLDNIYGGVSDNEQAANIAYTGRYFDSVNERLTNVFTALKNTSKVDVYDSYVVNMENIVASIMSIGSRNTVEGSIYNNSQSLATLKSYIEQLKKDYKNYINNQYFEISIITRDQAQEMIDTMNQLLDSLLVLYEEVFGYGAGS